MAITLTELVDSRESVAGTRPRVTHRYILEGTTDDVTAKIWVQAFTPSVYDGLQRDSVEIEPIHLDTVANVGKWDCRVQFISPQASPLTGSSQFSFDTGGGSQHITQSLATVGSYGTGTPPDFGGAIGVTHDSVEGVDITVPVYHFTETHYLQDVLISPAYKGTLFSLTGKVNDASFKGFAAGEVLFLGAAGAKRDIGDWEITFRFAASPNRVNIPIGTITVTSKKGWEYLWVRYADEEDAGSNTLVKKPLAAYVEQVYEEGNMSALGIGT